MKRPLLALALSMLALASPADSAERRQARGAAPPVSPCPPGFMALQNSGTCVRISGQVRAESVVGSSSARSSSTVEPHVGGRVQMDIRKQTEYGPFRAVIGVGGQRR